MHDQYTRADLLISCLVRRLRHGVMFVAFALELAFCLLLLLLLIFSFSLVDCQSSVNSCPLEHLFSLDITSVLYVGFTLWSRSDVRRRCTRVVVAGRFIEDEVRGGLVRLSGVDFKFKYSSRRI